MSGIKVTNERPARPIPDTSSVEGEVTDENVDWDPPTGGTVENDQWKQPVRVATTATVTIATALNAGDTIDGVTLVAGDRVLVKDQTAAEENGIYVAGTTPERAVDLDDDDEVLGAVVYVIAGTANAGTTWATTNTAATDIGTDAIDWAEVGGASIPTGTYELAIEGGQSVIKAHGAMGASETIDPSDGNVHTGILDANVTYTLNAPTGSGAAEIEFERTGSGGPWTETWPGSVTWLGGVAPTPPTSGNSSIVILRSLDGGTSWLGVPVGDASEPTADAHIADTSDAHDASAISIADAGSYYTGTDVEAALQEIGADLAAAGTGASDHAHVVSETHLSNGSTTTWTLDQVYEPGSVIAWNTTTLARLGVTEVLPDQATVSAAGTTGDSIVFDYAATVGA